MAYKAPIVHGVGFTNEIPTKCQMCAHKVQDENRWICNRREDGKFIGTIAYSCFTWPKKEKTGVNFVSEIKPKEETKSEETTNNE